MIFHYFYQRNSKRGNIYQSISLWLVEGAVRTNDMDANVVAALFESQKLILHSALETAVRAVQWFVRFVGSAPVIALSMWHINPPRHYVWGCRAVRSFHSQNQAQTSELGKGVGLGVIQCYWKWKWKEKRNGIKTRINIYRNGRKKERQRGMLPLLNKGKKYREELRKEWWWDRMLDQEKKKISSNHLEK